MMDFLTDVYIWITFYSKVEKTKGCWLWRGAINSKGYGNMKVNGKTWQAHRLAWEIEEGPIPPGMEVMHKCDNPICVRWSHLSLGTHKDNMDDAISKGRIIRKRKGLGAR